MSRSNNARYLVPKEIGPKLALSNCKRSKNFLNRKLRHDWQERVKIEMSYGMDDWAGDFPSIWDDWFDEYDVTQFKIMRDAA
jgi:hypothetical protein